MVSIALDEISAICPADAIGIYLFKDHQIDVYSRGVPDRAVSNYLSLPAGTDPILARMQDIHVPVHERSVFSEAAWRAHPLYDHAVAPFALEHYLVAPLAGHGDLIGALTLARGNTATAFEERDLTAIAVAGAWISVALACTQQGDAEAQASLSCLSAREKQVAILVAKGLGNREIAVQLGVSENTVKKHLKNMFENLGVSRRAELAWIVTLGGLA